jgi:hypothetical protein
MDCFLKTIVVRCVDCLDNDRFLLMESSDGVGQQNDYRNPNGNGGGCGGHIGIDNRLYDVP